MTVELQGEADADEEELGDLTRRLQKALLDLDVDEVTLAGSGIAVEGTKGGDILAYGTMLVRYVAQPEILMSLVRTVRSWLGRGEGRSVKLTLDGDSLEVTGATSSEQDRLIELWLARHAVPG